MLTGRNPRKIVRVNSRRISACRGLKMNKEKIREILPLIIYLASIIVFGAYCYVGFSVVQSYFEMFIIAGFAMILIFLAGIEYHLNSRK